MYIVRKYYVFDTQLKYIGYLITSNNVLQKYVPHH